VERRQPGRAGNLFEGTQQPGTNAAADRAWMYVHSLHFTRAEIELAKTRRCRCRQWRRRIPASESLSDESPAEGSPPKPRPRQQNNG